MAVKKVLLLLAGLVVVARSCEHPSPVPGYTNEAYSGLWYEIGRIQTPGGATYQQYCVCDTANFTSEYPVTGDGRITYSCRQLTVDGQLIEFTASLIAGEVPGNFAQRVFFTGGTVDYNIIWMDEDSAIEYDCGSPSGDEEYCIHFMSRNPTLQPEKLAAMMKFTDDLGLNTDIEYKAVLQDGCWETLH